MNRRDFLQPRQLAHAAGYGLAAVHEARSATAALAESPVPEVALLRMARRAMATTFALLVPFDTPSATDMATDAFDVIDALEAQLSVYRQTSEVCRLNRLAPYQAVPVESRLFELLCESAQISEETDGAFDIATGALIKAWGFFRGPRRVPSPEELSQSLQRSGINHITLSAESRSVRFHRAGLEINLGSIGKGHALDRAATLLGERWGLDCGLLHGGYSSVLALGNPPGDERGWSVAVRHPWQPGRRLATVRLRNQALGNSAATYQHLEHEGRKLGHVLDPRSGWPAAGIASSSAIAPTAAVADALSTAFFVGGMDVARAYCARHPEIGVILLPDGPGATPVVLGLSPDTYRLQLDCPPAADDRETIS